jgi:hypothetical protein
MPFSEIAERMEPAKVTFACSADFAQHFDRHSLQGRQPELLAAIPDPTMRETSRDFMINRQFRKDYWVKGARMLRPAEQEKALREHNVILVGPASGVTTDAGGSLAGSKLDEDLVKGVAACLADHCPKSLGEIADALAPSGVRFEQVVEVAMILVGNGKAASALDDSIVEHAKRSAFPFNRRALAASLGGQAIPVLASPVTGGGVPVTSFHQQFLLARLRGCQPPPDWAEFLWQHFLAQGTRVVRGGKTLESAEENLAALTEEAQAFATDLLAPLVGLGVAEP